MISLRRLQWVLMPMNSPKNDIRFNVLFWLGYFMYEWLVNASLDSEYKRYFINALVIVPITLSASVFTVHVLFKRFYVAENRQLFWVLLICSVVFFTLSRRAFNYYYTYPLYYPEGNWIQPFLFPPKVIIECVNIYLIAGVYSMFYLVRAWYEEQRIATELKQEKTEAELQLLKSQVHPHFIFNTLNNIYSYAVQQNRKTPDLIHRLSSFLSYNLYDSKANSIPLTRELEYIDSYIELEKIRYGERLDISVNKFTSTEDFYVSPLLLLPLIENCFKHGSAATSNDKCWIRVDISQQDDWLTVKIENNVNHEERPVYEKNGIGLENVKRRLEIIYPGSHEFRCVSGNGTYFIVLKVKNLERITENSLN